MSDSSLRFFLPLALWPVLAFAEVDDNGPLDGSDANDKPDVFVKIEVVPLAAMHGLREQVGTHDFKEVELDLDQGAPQYALQWEDQGRLKEVTVGAEGHLIKLDEKFAMKEIPALVRRSALGFFPPGIELEVEHTTVVTYEVQELGTGELRKLEIHPIGQILDTKGIELPESVREKEEEPKVHIDNAGYHIVRSIDTNELPAAVQHKLTSKADRNTTFTTIKRETYTGSSTYEAEWRTDNARFEALVSNDGELLVESQSVDESALPTGVRTIIDTYFPQNVGREYRVKLTSHYDIDTASPTLDHQIILDPSGRVHEASGFPHRTAASPSIRFIGDEIVVSHQAVPGFPEPHLEVSFGLDDARNWVEVPMSPVGDSLLKAQLPREEHAFFRVRLGDS